MFGHLTFIGFQFQICFSISEILFSAFSIIFISLASARFFIASSFSIFLLSASIIELYSCGCFLISSITSANATSCHQWISLHSFLFSLDSNDNFSASLQELIISWSLYIAIKIASRLFLSLLLIALHHKSEGGFFQNIWYHNMLIILLALYWYRFQYIICFTSSSAFVSFIFQFPAFISLSL